MKPLSRLSPARLSPARGTKRVTFLERVTFAEKESAVARDPCPNELHSPDVRLKYVIRRLLRNMGSRRGDQKRRATLARIIPSFKDVELPMAIPDYLIDRKSWDPAYERRDRRVGVGTFLSGNGCDEFEQSPYLASHPFPADDSRSAVASHAKLGDGANARRINPRNPEKSQTSQPPPVKPDVETPKVSAAELQRILLELRDFIPPRSKSIRPSCAHCAQGESREINPVGLPARIADVRERAGARARSTPQWQKFVEHGLAPERPKVDCPTWGCCHAGWTKATNMMFRWASVCSLLEFSNFNEIVDFERGSLDPTGADFFEPIRLPLLPDVENCLPREWREAVRKLKPQIEGAWHRHQARATASESAGRGQSADQ